MSKEQAQILVVEDEGIVAKDIQSRLTRLGYHAPAIVYSGEEAIKKTVEMKPDLILMDIRLTGLVNGIQAASEIKKKFNIPVVYVTAYADDNTIEQAKRSEPYGYILKPVQDKELSIVIEMALHKHSMEIKLQEREAWLSALLQSIADAVIATNKEGDILFMNHLAEKMTGWSEEEAKGKNLLSVFQVRDLQTYDFMKIKEKEAFEQDVTLITRDLIEAPIRETISTIRDSDGNTSGFVLVFKDISFRKRAEEALLHLTHDLARSNTELRNFAHLAAYELKDPLRVISGYAQLLSQRYEGKLFEDADRYLTFIVEKSVHLQVLIEDLLTRSKSGTGFKTRVELDARDVFNAACFNLQSFIDENMAVVEVEELPTLVVDEIQMIQLFQNLLENSIKFRSTVSPRIRVSAVRKENEWVFSISDNGIGIDEKERHQIFAPFYKINSSTPGYGIGLTICKNIVEGHGGKIWVKSELGKGSVFYFSFPF